MIFDALTYAIITAGLILAVIVIRLVTSGNDS